jgi:hypothetical protein
VTGSHKLAELLSPHDRILLIVNSAAAQLDEIERVVSVLDRAGALHRVSVITPASIAARLIERGISGAKLLRFGVEIGYFLETERALQWAARQRATLILGTEPYALNNEEVKTAFEQRVATLIGTARFLAHTLPADQVLVLTLADLWRRAGRDAMLTEHRARVARAIGDLHDQWSKGVPSDDHAAASLEVRLPQRLGPGVEIPIVQSALLTTERLFRALQGSDGSSAAPVRIASDPPGTAPRAGWLGGRLDKVRWPVQVAAGVKRRREWLWFRGQADGPYSYLLMSRTLKLRAGDAAVAEGRVYRGGVTIGLVKDDAWASRVDVIDPGEFAVAAVAREAGPHALVIANCLNGVDRRLAVAIRRFGLRRSE